MTAVAAPRAEVERVLREVITSILPGLPPEAVTGDRHLRDLGADSVDRVEIIIAVTVRLGVDVPLSTFSDTPDIDRMVDQLVEANRR